MYDKKDGIRTESLLEKNYFFFELPLTLMFRLDRTQYDMQKLL